MAPALKELISGLQEKGRERMGPAGDAAAEFIAQYYRRLDPDDLPNASPEDLYGAAMSHWQLLQKRKAGEARLRVINPSVPEHGWQSPHTVIEIVNDDMPFLVDSLTNEINRHGLTAHRVIHPVIEIQRDAKGAFKGIAADGKGSLRESVIHAEVDRRSDAESIASLSEGITRVLADVRAAVGDWQNMVGLVESAAQSLKAAPTKEAAGDRDEQVAFLHWLAAGNFTLLGYRCYDLGGSKAGEVLKIVPDSGLGILRGGDATPAASNSFASLAADLRAQAHSPQALIVTKSNSRATVHRSGYLDYVGVKRFDAKGKVIGEHRFLGLFTSAAYSASPWQIPLLRRKAQQILELASFRPDSHAGKALKTIIDQFPRDELIQATVDEVFETAMGILQLGERQRVRLFIRRDPYRRFYSCLVFVPRDRYDTALRVRIQNILMPVLGGVSVEHNVVLSESVLARLQLIIRVDAGGEAATHDVRALEAKILAATRDWDDQLAAALVEAHGEEKGGDFVARYRGAFPASYREQSSARTALFDIALVESAANGGDDIAASLFVPPDAPPQVLRLKVARVGGPLVLSDSMPMLENLGVRVVDEQPFTLRRRDGVVVCIHDFGLEHPTAREAQPLDQLRTLVHDAFLRVWRTEVENDRFNALVLAAGLDWRRVKVLRAYAKYMRQAGLNFSPQYIAATLCTHAGVAVDLARLFETCFDPAVSDREPKVAEVEARIEAALAKVENLDDDRILRQYLALIQATLRTSYYRRDGGDVRHYVSFKLDPHRIPGLPEPRPKFEIFVFSPRIEGVHLRGGSIARGGLRWSDRLEDYRTEVLGLVKAQLVKNAVIVPTGSKGGFVVKRPPVGGDREALLAEGVTCYKTYLKGLLDITDNLVDGAVVPPPDVVRRDGDDPYLVVAADKGTATFSDIANGVAAEYGFWLGDAFASGGSVGYDHKKMGITARGAWESVKHHFRQLGVDTQSEDFTVAGVGDMSGDVFGNGMLLSKHIRLIAAFDHRHIFIDPNPDSATSYAERERLFALPRSSWEDYDKKLISKGGGVWPRKIKSIPLSPEAQRALGVDAKTLSSPELISAILRAPVDLFYNGGIGTYVKASDESHAQVGDRANDGLRVDATELRCRVVAEGGNLGLTQRARIEFAAGGGRIYTDAIDNSAGVDCSDHEVNIKILLGGIVAAGDMTLKQRDRLLEEMTDEVAALVLQDNIRQTQVLSAMAARAPQLFGEQVRYMRELERAGRLIRRIEYLPNDEAIDERRLAGEGLWLPELSVLLAYSKMDLYDGALASNAPDDTVIAEALTSYFPKPLQKRFATQIAAHPLHREIITTVVTNELVNRVGCTFAYRLTQETGADAGAIVRAYVLAREVFGLGALWHQLDELERLPADAQRSIGGALARQAERAALWFLRRPATLEDLAASVKRFRPVVTAIDAALDEGLQPVEHAAFGAAIKARTDTGVPADVARSVAAMVPLHAALDITEVVAETGQEAVAVAGAYFDLVGRLDLYWLSSRILELPASSRWEERARSALRDDLEAVASTLTAWIFRQCDIGKKGCDAKALLDSWQQTRAAQLGRYLQMLGELKQGTPIDWAMISVLLRELKALSRI